MHLNSETSHSIFVIDPSSNFWLKPCDIAQVTVLAAAQRYGITTMARRSLNCREAVSQLSQSGLQMLDDMVLASGFTFIRRHR